MIFFLSRDIKGANLLVDASGVVKLADFGLAKHVSFQKSNAKLKMLLSMFVLL